MTPVSAGGGGRAARLLRRAPALIGLVLLAAATVAVTREFRHLRIADILDAIGAIPTRARLEAAGWTVAAFGVLTFYDRLATRYAGCRVAWRRTAFASFTAYVLSHNLGFSAVSGGAVRFRLYTAWGLAPAQIARIVAFCSVTFAVGSLAIAGGIAIFATRAVPVVGHGVSSSLVVGIGIGAWALVACYAGLGRRVPRIHVAGHAIDLPGPSMAVRQVALAVADVSIAAAIAYTLLPHAPHLAYPRFLVIYLVSYSAGLLASVPGGLGVFETAMLFGLHPYLPAPTILGAVLVFRLYYYIVPLFLAGGLFSLHELYLRGLDLGALLGPLRPRPPAGRRSRLLRATEADLSVAVSTGLTALSGAALVAIGGLQPRHVAGPFSALLASHAGFYALSLLGSALMVLAIGLSRRVTLAWALAIMLLGFGAVICLVEQLSPWVAAAAGLAALMMLPFRDAYYRHARILSEPLDPGTGLTLFALAGCLLILGRLEPEFDYLERSSWWQLVASPMLPDRLRIAMGLLVAVLLIATFKLVRPGRVSFLTWDESCRRRFLAFGIEPPVGADGIVLGESGRSCIAFRRVGGMLLGLGDPAGPGRDRLSAILRLRDLAVQEGRLTASWRSSPELLEAWNEIGLTAWPIGRDFMCCSDESDLLALVDALGPADRGIAKDRNRTVRGSSPRTAPRVSSRRTRSGGP